MDDLVEMSKKHGVPNREEASKPRYAEPQVDSPAPKARALHSYEEYIPRSELRRTDRDTTGHNTEPSRFSNQGSGWPCIDDDSVCRYYLLSNPSSIFPCVAHDVNVSSPELSSSSRLLPKLINMNIFAQIIHSRTFSSPQARPVLAPRYPDDDHSCNETANPTGDRPPSTSYHELHRPSPPPVQGRCLTDRYHQSEARPDPTHTYTDHARLSCDFSSQVVSDVERGDDVQMAMDELMALWAPQRQRGVRRFVPFFFGWRFWKERFTI